MGSIADNMCPVCQGEIEDGGGGYCGVCASRPAASESLVQHKLLALGRDVANPTRENTAYDLLYNSVHGWQKVQVKTAYKTKSGVRVNLCRTNSSGRKLYTSADVDSFAVVDGTTVYLIPFHVVEGKGRVSIRSSKYRQWKLN